MTSGWERGRTEPVALRSERRSSRLERARREQKRRRRKNSRLAILAVLIVGVIFGVFLVSKFVHTWFGDFSGEGKSDVVIQVHDGDSTTAVGQTLQDSHVVSSRSKFVEAAQGNSAISSIQPGYYKMRTEISADAAVRRLADPANRVGKLVIPEGRQLDDVTDVKTNAVTEGIFTLISRASCVQINDEQRCVSADGLRDAAKNDRAAALNVPAWAAPQVDAMGGDHRRLEGLIAPGTWNIDPAWTPEEALATVIGGSAEKYSQRGLGVSPDGMTMSPYGTLTVASLVQRESKPADFGKVAQVIYNRLQVHQKLEFDSTVNYSLDRQEVATTDADRARNTPWNTYLNEGLPKTPICSPGDQALAAAERPEPGNWLYFVTVDMQGTTLFTADYAEHLRNIELAKKNGVLDSGR
ncbi:MAG: hypothetical protein QOH57_4353 [Mycobacterium sp.]|nr:hypothetical protein [Mycobacterium sp.]